MQNLKPNGCNYIVCIILILCQSLFLKLCMTFGKYFEEKHQKRDKWNQIKVNK